MVVIVFVVVWNIVAFAVVVFVVVFTIDIVVIIVCPKTNFKVSSKSGQ